MLKTQEFILSCIENNQDPFLKLAEEFSIKSTIYPDDGLVILNYSQIESPKSHPIVIECRSLILNSHTYGVVSRKYDRFFNYGECPEYYADFDISSSYTFTKEDGSLIGVYYNNFTSTWEISTRSLAKAEGDHISGGTFREKVLNAFGYENEQHFQDYMNEKGAWENTYIFEYCGPSNRIVTRYENEEMVLTGIRSNVNGAWFPPEIMERFASEFRFAGLNVRAVKSYPLNSYDDVLEAIKNLPTLAEGYVCFDPVSGKRVKIKNPSYVAIHGLRENGALSMKKVYTLVLMNEQEEYLAYFPEDREAFAPAINQISEFIRHLEMSWMFVDDVTDQKQFALLVKNLRGSGCFFEAKKKGTTPMHVFNEMDMNKKLRLFENFM